MADIPQSTIDEANSDIVSVVSRYVTIKKTGKNYSGCCPFHKERSPSFTVSPEKLFYYCFGCGAGGDAVSFVMEFEGVDFRQAVEKIVGNLDADFSNRPKQASIERASCPSSHRSNPDKAASDLSRAIEADDHPLFRREHTASFYTVQTLANCLALPLVNVHGELVNVAAIAPDYRVFWSAGGHSFGAWAVIQAREPGPRILCADYFDGWRLWWKLRGKCEIRCTISPDVFIWMTRKMRSVFDMVAVPAEDVAEYEEFGLEVVALADV